MLDLKPTQIVVETRKGTPIENYQYVIISIFELSQIQLFDQKYGPRVKFRTNPIATYNCHGMIFASRRTSIHDPQEIAKIISEDEYDQIDIEKVMPGDIVLYYGEQGDIEHSAIVISEPSKNALKIPFVISKWGKYKEVSHPANVCPYSFKNARYFRITK